MTLTEMIAIGAAIISFGSMCAAIASARFARRNAKIAEQAKEQARKAATLEPRTKAINHIHEAHFEVTNNGYVTGKTVNSLHEAMKIAARVFSREIRTELDRAHATATELNVPSPLTSQWLPRTVEFGKNLETLIARMNEEAALAD